MQICCGILWTIAYESYTHPISIQNIVPFLLFLPCFPSKTFYGQIQDQKEVQYNIYFYISAFPFCLFRLSNRQFCNLTFDSGYCAPSVLPAPHSQDLDDFFSCPSNNLYSRKCSPQKVTPLYHMHPYTHTEAQ